MFFFIYVYIIIVSIEMLCKMCPFMMIGHAWYVTELMTRNTRCFAIIATPLVIFDARNLVGLRCHMRQRTGTATGVFFISKTRLIMTSRMTSGWQNTKAGYVQILCRI